MLTVRPTDRQTKHKMCLNKNNAGYLNCFTSIWKVRGWNCKIVKLYIFIPLSPFKDLYFRYVLLPVVSCGMAEINFEMIRKYRKKLSICLFVGEF